MYQMLNYLAGYVIMDVYGFSTERFLNLAVHKGIILWNINRNTKGIRANVSIKNLKKLKPCLKKTKSRLKIIRKRGFPFVIQKYKKRKFWILGIAFFVSFLFFLSSLVWSVEIKGYNRIRVEDLKSYSQEIGVKPGAYKKNIDVKNIEQSFLNQFKDISWISVSKVGTKIIIELTETIETPQIIDRKTPCNVVALKSGLIISLATKAGTPLVKPLDVVEAGEVLVSSEIQIVENDAVVSTEYVHASAIILAKLWNEFSFEENMYYDNKVYTGKTKKVISFEIFDKLFSINNNITYVNYDRISDIKRLNFGGEFLFPFSFTIDEYKEYFIERKNRSEEETKAILDARIDEMLNEKFLLNAEVLDKSIIYDIEDFKMTATVLVISIERIDKEEYLEGTN